ncbi:MAG: PEP-CTERM sorting domain-containing protein [Pirellulales bacterium]
MNATSKMLICGFVMFSWGVSTVSAQQSATIPIDLIVVQDQPVELFFPNDFDLEHPKVVNFTGTLQNLDPTGGSAIVDLFFDWFDPRSPGEVFYSEIFPYELGPGEILEISPTYTIPFCPPQVSFDLRVAGGPVQVKGDFTHICVPEPGTWGLLALGMAAVTSAAVRRRRK